MDQTDSSHSHFSSTKWIARFLSDNGKIDQSQATWSGRSLNEPDPGPSWAVAGSGKISCEWWGLFKGASGNYNSYAVQCQWYFSNRRIMGRLFNTQQRLRLLIAIDAILGFPDRVVKYPDDYNLSKQGSLEDMKNKLQSLLERRLRNLQSVIPVLMVQLSNSPLLRFLIEKMLLKWLTILTIALKSAGCTWK